MAELPKADQGKRPEPLAMEFEKENETLSFSLLIRFLNGKKFDFKKDGKPFPQNSETVMLLYEKETPQSCDCSLGRKGRPFPSWMDAS